MDMSSIVKEAAWIGLATGVIIFGAVILWLIAAQLLKPATTVAAATTAIPFGFSMP